MEMGRWPKVVLCGSLPDVGKRPQGHPYLRWTDMVRKDLQDVDVPLEQCIRVCKSNRWNGIRRKGKQADTPRVVRLWPCGGDYKFQAKSKAGLCTHRKRCVTYARAKGRYIDVALIPCGGDCGFSAKSNAGLANHRRSRGCATRKGSR